ncbi:MAG: tagatose 3-epimerase [Gemmatales bacterium]|nr:MAG: tagatose 3-epimerase [Gemmatales bacterium]
MDRRTFFRTCAATALASQPLRGLGAAGDAVPFKFAICNETFGKWEFEKAFAFAAKEGYKGIEIAPFTVADYVTDVPAKKRAGIRRLAEKEGLEIVGLHWLLARTKGLHLTSPDKAVRQATARYLAELARFNADLGGKLLVFGSPKQRNLPKDVTREKGLQYAAEVVREVLPVLEKTDVTLAFEPLSPRTTNFLRTAKEAVELIKIVDAPRCRLILDCLAMSSEKTPIPELIRTYRHYLVHFHANDPNSRGPGMGELDFVPIFRALRDIRYQGWISVEVFDYSPGPERLARDSIRYMKKCAARN